jgi:hypothetical protein
MAKSWLKRNFQAGTFFRMPLTYLVNHLSPYDKNKVLGRESPLFESWQNKKEKGICDRLDNGTSPRSIEPIRVNIHPTREMFYVNDGISRIRAFRKRRMKNIGALMGYY